MPVWEWPTRTPDGTRVVLRFAEVDGRVECVGLEVGADFNALNAPDPEPLTVTNLRKIHLPPLVEEAARHYLDWLREQEQIPGFLNTDAPTDYDQRILARLHEIARARRPAATAKRRQGRTGRPVERGPEHLAQVAKVYTDAHLASLPPTRAVAEEWTVSRSTAAKWVARAREARLLGPTEPRKAGGVPVEDRPAPETEPPHQ
jgi:hypothetical protein